MSTSVKATPLRQNKMSSLNKFFSTVITSLSDMNLNSDKNNYMKFIEELNNKVNIKGLNRFELAKIKLQQDLDNEKIDKPKFDKYLNEIIKREKNLDEALIPLPNATFFESGNNMLKVDNAKINLKANVKNVSDTDLDLDLSSQNHNFEIDLNLVRIDDPSSIKK